MHRKTGFGIAMTLASPLIDRHQVLKKAPVWGFFVAPRFGVSCPKRYTEHALMRYDVKVGHGPTFCFWGRWSVCHMVMTSQERELCALVEPAVVAFGHELLGVQWLRQGSNSLLRVYIDNQQGIGVDDCADVSTQVSGVLDVEDPVKGHYTLEVSSPGLDRPLFTAAQFEQFVGQPVNVSLTRPFQGRRKMKGELAAVEGSSIKVLDEEDEWLIPLDMIRQARLIPLGT